MYLPSNYAVWRNVEKSNLEELFRAHKFDEGTKNKIQKEHDAMLLAAQNEYNYIMENAETLDVRIIGYEQAKLYPRISFVTKFKEYDKNKKCDVDKSKAQDRHLKSEVPNVLWFDPMPYRMDMEVKEFIENSQHAFGDVYFQKRP
jgi:hypothetical protein